MRRLLSLLLGTVLYYHQHRGARWVCRLQVAHLPTAASSRPTTRPQTRRVTPARTSPRTCMMLFSARTSRGRRCGSRLQLGVVCQSFYLSDLQLVQNHGPKIWQELLRFQSAVHSRCRTEISRNHPRLLLPPLREAEAFACQLAKRRFLLQRPVLASEDGMHADGLAVRITGSGRRGRACAPLGAPPSRRGALGGGDGAGAQRRAVRGACTIHAQQRCCNGSEMPAHQHRHGG